ncbi:MAG TPA: PKD domain-containing protein [Cytophagaceae bacterium]|nr:PKD domain-containing protein [Cytophagaceae bacterium]
MRSVYPGILQLLPFYFIILLIIYLSLPISLFGQGEGNVWYFGKGNGLDFNFSPPAQLQNGNVNLLAVATGEGVGAMSDANGNLLFYTNGNVIFDKTHTAMPNGTGLNGDDNTVQTGLIVPVQGSTTQYYAIETGSGGGKPVKYVIVDMTLNGGLGDVVIASKGGTNGVTLVASAGEGSLAIPEYTAGNVPTGNYWVIQHSSSSADYYVSKATSAGISAPVTQTVGTASINGVMMFKTNSCFDKIGVAYYKSGRVEILPFNNVTGIISPPTTTLAGTGGAPFLNPEVYGIEFSPSGQFLYVTESGLNSRKTIYQFDISAGAGLNPAAVLASKSFYTGGAEVVRFGAVQLAPDGRIYFPGWNPAAPGYINAIPTPDIAWTKPNPTLGTDLLYKQYSYLVNEIGEGLPPVLKNLLTSVKIYYTNACEGGTTNFSYIFGSKAVSQTWDFGDPGSGAANTSASATPSHIYATAGTYTVTLTIVDNCGRTRTGTVSVIIKSGPLVTIPAAACPNTNVTFTGTGTNKANYTWSTSPSGPFGSTGSTYTYNGTLPKTIYVQDPTPLATYTVGQTSEPDCFSPTTGNVYFEIFTSLTITSFQLQCKASTSASNVSIQNDLGTITYWGPVAAPVVNGALLTMTPNVTLAPGKYRFFTSDPTGAFCRNTTTTPDGGRNVGGVINVTGENNGIKAGSFFNIKIAIPDPCGIRAYTVVDNCGLPVSFVEFTAERSGKASLLHWITSSEKNNDHFKIERSENGLDFKTIGTIAGKGNSSSLNFYSFTDISPVSGKNYYRSVQVDIDGTETNTRVILLDFNSAGVSLAPNPFQGNTTLSFMGNDEVRIKVIDLSGRVLEMYTRNTSENQVQVGSRLASGSYLIQVISENVAEVFKIIKE